MRHRHVMAVDRVGRLRRARVRRQMRDDLVPEQVEVDSRIARPPLRTAQHTTVKGARRGKVMDGKGEMERTRHEGP
jgi:hypothetical protein